MATPLHPFQAPQRCEENAPPPQQSCGSPIAYGAPSAGYGAGGATPGYAYGTVQGSVPPSTSGGYPSDAASGIQGNAFGAPNAAGYMLETGGAMSKPPAGHPPASYPPAGYPSSGIAVNPVVVAAATASIATAGDTTPAQVDPRDQIETNRWAADLCSCCSICVPNCLVSCCCPFVSLAQIYARIGVLPYKVGLVMFLALYIIGMIGFVAPTKTSYAYNYETSSYEATETSLGSTIVSTIVPIGQTIFCLYIWHARASIRERFRIPGDCCTDCLTSCCCSCCAIAQMATHIKSYRPGSCGFEGPNVLSAYAR